jgi:hypothetical protein
MKKNNIYFIVTLLLFIQGCSSVKLLDPASNFSLQVEFQNELKSITKLNSVSENSSGDFYIVFENSMVHELPVQFVVQDHDCFFDSIGNTNWERDMAYMVNRIPEKSNYWKPTNELLWDNYRECLRSIDFNQLTKVQAANSIRRENLRKFLTENGPSYHKYMDLYINSLQSIHSSVIANDSLQLQINRIISDKAYKEWNLFGKKTNYEDSMTSLSVIDFKSGVNSLRNALSDIDPFSIYYVSDPYFMNYYSTGFQPDLERIRWQEAIVPITNFTRNENSEKYKYKISNSFLKFRYCIVSVERPWFHPELFKDQEAPLRFKTPKKELRYIKSFVLTSNIEFEYQIESTKKMQLTTADGEKRLIKKGEPALINIKYSNKMGISAYICKL